MSRIEKLRKRLLLEPKDFTWTELVLVMKSFGYHVNTNSGSRRSFQQDGYSAFFLHQPHPSDILKPYQVRLAIDHLKKEGHI